MSLAHLLNNDSTDPQPPTFANPTTASPVLVPDPQVDAPKPKRKRPSRAAAAFVVDDDPEGLARRVSWFPNHEALLARSETRTS